MTEGWFRRVVTQAASQDWVEDFIRQSPLSRRMVERFVAGNTRDDALKAAVALAAKGMTAALDHLGEEKHGRVQKSASARHLTTARLASRV